MARSGDWRNWEDAEDAQGQDDKQRQKGKGRGRPIPPSQPHGKGGHRDRGGPWWPKQQPHKGNNKGGKR